jgi:hypothetical protein
MAGLLGTLFGNADQTQALGLLGAGLMSGNAPGGFQSAMSLLAQAPDKALERQIKQAQIDNYLSEVAQRKAALEHAQRKQAAIPDLWSSPAVPASPGQLGSGSFGIQPTAQGQSDMPQMGAPQLNARKALEAGYSLDEIPKLDALRNLGLNKVARTVKATGPDGREYEYQMDDFGRPVGAPMAQYRAPISVNRGNSTDYLDPYKLQPIASFKTFQSPDSAASNAVTMRGQNMTDARQREANELGKVPAGYRQKADGTGLEFIPGGPADPNAAKKAAPTEFQGKSATFGARALEADKILNELGTNYSPLGINTKSSAARVPLVGGALEYGANLTLSDNSQKAEQAQRNFVNAVLRQESGAAINRDEFDNARKQYFPQPGDSQVVIAQKARNRQLAINGFRENSRPGAVDEVVNGGPGGNAPGAAAINPNDPLGLRR